MATQNGSQSYSVAGKSAIVTGGGSGINLEFAALLLSQGCNVLVADLALRPEAEKIYANFAKGPARTVFLRTDVTNWTDLRRTFEVAIEQFGDVDIVCPGAGLFEPVASNFWHPPGVAGSASKDPVDGFGHFAQFDVNISHPVRMTQLAISHFLNPPAGAKRVSPAHPKRVVHIASIASEIALLPVPMYIASKWALSGFVRSLEMLEPMYGIRVNAVAPGCVKTPLWTEQADKLPYMDESKDKWVTTIEVAGAMLKLIQDADLPAGTVLEVGVDNTRPIPLMGNTGPQGPGHELSNLSIPIGEIHETLNRAGWGVVPK